MWPPTKRPAGKQQPVKNTSKSAADGNTTGAILSDLEKERQECDSLSSKWSMKNYRDMPESVCESFKKKCHVEQCNQMMDIVTLWVDGSDPEIQRKRKEEVSRLGATDMANLDEEANWNGRYRELGQFRYALRGIERNFPIYRRIFVVTNDQHPKWLNISHPRIRIIDHSQLEPPRQNQLFNSMAIQSMIHTIPTLSSPFYYMEDDMAIVRKVKIDQIFDSKEKCINLQTTAMPFINENGITDGLDPSSYEKTVLNAIRLAKRRKWDMSYFFKGPNATLSYNSHIPKCLFTEDIKNLWDNFPDEMLAMSRRSFRSILDPQFWILYFAQDGKQIKNNYDKPRSHSFYLLSNDESVEKLHSTYAAAPVTFLCVNDDFDADGGALPSKKALSRLDEFYKNLLPHPATFELV